jgi:hypothetical protein
MAKVVWTEFGRLWLQKAIGYIAKGNRKKAARLTAQAFVNFIRELLISPFRIIYLYQDNVCPIVAVIHERRDLLSLLRLEDLEDGAFG